MNLIVKGVVIYLLSTFTVYSCDICGGAGSSFSTGLLPSGKNHVFGFRTTMRWFNSYPAPDGHGYRGVSKQYFTSSDIFGQIKIGKRFQAQLVLPFVVNKKTDSISTRIQGIGDVVAMGNFIFVDQTDSIEKKVRHVGTIGVGVKAPTGQYFKLGFEEVNMLPGTGSWDVIAALNYAIHFGKFGTQNESSYTFKTANKYLYRFGDGLSITQLVFYKLEFRSNFKLIPQLGLNFAHNWMDKKNGVVSEDTFNGGNILNGQVNLIFQWNSFGINLQTYMPIYQGLNRGYVKQRFMFRLGLNYLLTSKK
ncbi:MAG TPA: hypothetical protein VKZ44_08410 [Taishania sp.]|nr:hypothetical protein [Taishania sp.]